MMERRMEHYEGDSPQSLVVQADAQYGLPQELLPYRGKARMVYMMAPERRGGQPMRRQMMGETGWRTGRPVMQIKGETLPTFDTAADYRQALIKAFACAKELLRQDGCIFVQTGDEAVHHVRLALDAVFSESHFLNDIIWHFRATGRSKRRFTPRHEHILFYRAGGHAFFAPEAAGRQRGDAITGHLRREVDEQGRTLFTMMSGGKTYTYRETDLIYADDVWSDIPVPEAGEDWGAEKSRPMALMQRLVETTTEEGDMVCQLYAGDGGMLEAARRAGRQAIGMEKDGGMLHLLRKRLTQDGGGLTLWGVKEAMPGDWPPADIVIASEITGRGHLRAELMGLSIAGVPEPDRENFLPDAPLCDGWGIGVMQAGQWHCRAMSLRSLKRPHLDTVLSMKVDEGEQSQAMVTDVSGRRIFIPLTR